MLGKRNKFIFRKFFEQDKETRHITDSCPVPIGVLTITRKGNRKVILSSVL
jgi:hypothetical protein